MSPHTLHRSTIPPVSGEKDKQSASSERRVEENNNGLVNKEDKRKEGRKLALTGECACKTARSLGNCGVVVGRR